MRIVKFLLVFFAVLILVVLFGLGFVFLEYRKIPSLDKNKSILILGKGGVGHTGPNLTDTIMVANLNTINTRTTLFSLPRDIWISDIRAKLNTAYHYGGLEMAKTSVQSVTGVQTDNVIVVDFDIFKELIDNLGGIEVEVENSFTDNLYPIAGKENDPCSGDLKYLCRYETISFSKGLQTMDGETALKFVRSRNSQDNEGTDLAREKRQQKIILAIKNKVVSTEFLLNPSKIKMVYATVVDNVETDIKTATAFEYAKFIFDSKLNLQTINIPEEFLKVSRNEKRYDYQYVFLPNSGSWKEVQEWLNSKI